MVHFLADDLGAEETDLVCQLVLKRPDCGRFRYSASPGKTVALFLGVKKDCGSCIEIPLKQHFRPVGVFPVVLGKSCGESCKAASGLGDGGRPMLQAAQVSVGSHCPEPCRWPLEGPLPP